MKIDRVELYHVRMPLIYPWRTAYGDDPDIHSVILKMYAGNEFGISEIAPLRLPTFSPEWTGGGLRYNKRYSSPTGCGS